MSGSTITDDEARSLIVAQLGRSPQDCLEAAVVLEAWGGLTAADALALSHRCVNVDAHLDEAPWASIAADPDDATRKDRLAAIGDVGFVIGVLFTGFWLSSLANELGERSVDRAWRMALPLSLGLHWMLKRRYVSGEDGLGRLKQELLALAWPLAGLFAALSLVPDGGLLAAGLAAIWTGGFIVTRRGWGVAYALALVTVAVVFRSAPAGWVMSVTTIAIIAASAYALLTVGRSRRRPGPWARAVPAGLVGASLGLLLVFEPPFGWSSNGRYLPVLTVIPSLVGSLWGGFHMTRLWDVMPAVLISTSVRDRKSGTIGRLTSRLLLESLGRLALGVGIPSVLLVIWVTGTPAFARDRHIVVNLLIAHGALAVAALSVSLLEAFGRWGWALLAAALGVLAAFVSDQIAAQSVDPGIRILIGAMVALVASSVPLVALLREPDRNVAAAL